MGMKQSPRALGASLLFSEALWERLLDDSFTASTRAKARQATRAAGGSEGFPVSANGHQMGRLTCSNLTSSLEWWYRHYSFQTTRGQDAPRL